jgi:hypothetical protein
MSNKNEQLVRYYGYYSNKSRGLRKKEDTDSKISTIVHSNITKKQFRKNWVRLVQKVYNVDPLLCPKCFDKMHIISFIEDHSTIKKILKHLNLWMPVNNSPPENKSKTHSCDLQQIPDYDSLSQIE